MIGKSKRALWATGLLTAVAAGTLTGSPAGALGGDPAATGTAAFTAHVDIGDGKRACTGTLVNNRWMITAASCFATDPAQPQSVAAGAPGMKAVATIGRADLNGTGGQVRQIVELKPRADRDLVLAKLDQTVPGVRPLPAAGTAPTAGETFGISGYGRTKSTWIPERLHTGSVTAGATTATTMDVDGTPICRGDAGAPVFRGSGDRQELAAVVTNSWQGGCLGSSETRTGARATRVDDLGSWIAGSMTSTLTPWKLQTLVTTEQGSLSHAVRDSNADWTGFGDVQAAAGAIGGVRTVAEAGVNGDDYVLAVGTDGRVHETVRQANGGWSAFRDLSAQLSALTNITKLTATSTGNGVALIAVADGKVYHSMRDAAGNWLRWGDVSSQTGALGNITQVTASYTGDVQQVGVVADGRAYHAVRYADGRWSGWGQLTSAMTGISTVQQLAFAGSGGNLQVVVTGTDGAVRHGIRAAAGTWGSFGDLSGVLGTSVARGLGAAIVDGEFQLAMVTTDGRIRHTVRHVNGAWAPVVEPTRYSGVPSSIVLTATYG